MADRLDVCRVELSQLDSVVSLQVQDMVVEPFAFYKQHLQLFTLFLVQPFLDNLAFIDFADLMLPTYSRRHLCQTDLVPLCI